jgi:hypothetical protein
LKIKLRKVLTVWNQTHSHHQSAIARASKAGHDHRLSIFFGGPHPLPLRLRSEPPPERRPPTRPGLSFTATTRRTGERRATPKQIGAVAGCALLFVRIRTGLSSLGHEFTRSGSRCSTHDIPFNWSKRSPDGLALSRNHGVGTGANRELRSEYSSFLLRDVGHCLVNVARGPRRPQAAFASRSVLSAFFCSTKCFRLRSSRRRRTRWNGLPLNSRPR